MKSLKTYIDESFGGSAFKDEDPHYGMSQWKRWESKHKKEFNIVFDDEIQCYLIYTKSKANKIGQHVGTYNALDGMFYYDSAEIKDIYN